MPLRLIPDLPSAPHLLKRYYARVGNGKASVGQIYESNQFTDQKTRWQYGLMNLPPVAGVPPSSPAATKEEAFARLQKQWEAWLAGIGAKEM